MSVRVVSCLVAWMVVYSESCFFFECYGDHRDLHVLTHSFPTRRSSDLKIPPGHHLKLVGAAGFGSGQPDVGGGGRRGEGAQHPRDQGSHGPHGEINRRG